MRVPRIVPAIICVLFATSIAFAHKVRVDYDHSVDLSKYKTFRFLETPQSENPLMDERIVKAVTAQLTARGLEPVTGEADLNIKASQSIEEQKILNTYYGGFDGWGPGLGWDSGWYGPGWYGPGWSSTYVDTYLEGTTVVDLIDNASEKTIWHAVATGSVDDKPEKASRKTAKLIAQMFEGYPFIKARISD